MLNELSRDHVKKFTYDFLKKKFQNGTFMFK